MDADMFRFEVGYKLDVHGLLTACPWVQQLSSGALFFTEFIRVNYGVLKDGYNPHKPVFRSLVANGIEPLTLQFQGLPKPCPRVEEEGEGITQGRKERASEGPQFDEWWTPYAKGSRKLSEAEWAKLTPKDRQACISATPAYIASKPDKQFRKDGERFLKHRTWEDPIVDPVAVAQPNGKMTSDQAREAIAALRTKHGIKPGGAIDSHLIPDHIREALR